MTTNTLAQLYYAYRRPNRHFHGLDHIADCFREYQKAKHLATNDEAMRFAIWFHDYVYEGTQTNNEELSATAAYEAAIREGHDETFARTVQSMVLATKHSDKYPPMSSDEELICDVDLTSLAADDFDAKTDLIRLEYAHVPADLFNAGRKAILVKFLEKPIYKTQFFRDLYETKARENLIAAIAKL